MNACWPRRADEVTSTSDASSGERGALCTTPVRSGRAAVVEDGVGHAFANSSCRRIGRPPRIPSGGPLTASPDLPPPSEIAMTFQPGGSPSGGPANGLSPGRLGRRGRRMRRRPQRRAPSRRSSTSQASWTTWSSSFCVAFSRFQGWPRPSRPGPRGIVRPLLAEPGERRAGLRRADQVAVGVQHHGPGGRVAKRDPTRTVVTPVGDLVENGLAHRE